MEDSIERILDDARKSTSDYRDRDVRESCGSFSSKTIGGSCETAQSIDLMKRTRALFERQLHEGVEWPRFVTSIHLRQHGGVPTLAIGEGGGKACVMPSERVKRNEPADTQEKIDADAEKSFCEYFGHGSGICKDGDVCEAHGSSEPCRALMIRDLLRRQRELCERGAR